MKKLTPQAFQHAKSFIFHHGRTLERRLFDVHFAQGPKEAVLAALAPYQNEDGGFGHALEPDSRASVSSAVATQQAFMVLRDIGALSSEALVQRAVDYLLRTYDSQQGVWRIIPPEIEQAPHAPWWSYADSAQNFGGFLANPRAALLGYLYDYHELVLAEFLTQVTEAVIAQLERAPVQMVMFDLHCYVSLAETRNLPEDVKSRIRAKLVQIAPDNVELNAAKWTEYVLTPLGLVTSPDHFLAAVIPSEALEANLDFLIDQQQTDGSWAPAWNWAFVDEAAWQAAEREWKSHLTLANLKLLHAFGRIEHSSV
jgi:hypothetical protein